MAAQDYVSVVQQLYISYFGRPADYFGLKNYTERLEALKAPTDFTELNKVVQADKAGTSELSKLVNSFNTSPEAIALYGTDNSNLGISKFLVAVFENVLGRTPELGPGWDFWFNALASGNLRRADAAMAITEGALNNTEPQGLIDAALVAKKNAVATNFTAALDTPAKINAYSTQAAIDVAVGLLEGVTATTDVTAYQADVVAAVDAVVITSIPVVTTNLTADANTVNGSVGNDIINAVLSSTAGNQTLNGLDVIKGNAGNDTLNLLVEDAGFTFPGALQMTGVENVNVRAADDVTLDLPTAAGISGVTNLTVSQSKAVTLDAATSTNVTVSGATEGITINGGANVKVTDATADQDIIIGANGTGAAAAGTITVTDTKVGNGDIVVDGGTDVTIVASDVATGSAIDVGQDGTNPAPTGAIKVTSTGSAYDDAAGNTLGDISVKGGTTIAVTQVATSSAADAAADDTPSTITQGNIAITAGTKTTTVTVKQDAASAGNAATATTGGVTETNSVKFAALTAGQTVILGGLTLTAVANMTAAEVAGAFANLASAALKPTDAIGTVADGDTQSAAAHGKATYSGSINGWTTGAAVGDTVVFTYTANTVVGALTAGGTGTAPTITQLTDGKAHDATFTGGAAVVVAGDVSIAGGAALTTVSVDGYGATSGGITGGTNTALNNVTLSNGAGFAVASAAATLGLKLVNVTGTVDVAAGTTTLNANVSGTGTATLKSASATTVNVSGTGKVAGTTAAGGLTAATAITTTGMTAGTATFTVADATVTSYTGGAATDIVTISNGATAVTKTIDLGAGDDTLTLVGATVVVPTATLKGGAGTDSLSIDVASADALDGNTNFAGKLDGFERLVLNDAVASTTINLENLGFTNYVTTTGSSGTLTLNNLASNGTVVITTAPTTGFTIGVKDAATGAADVANIKFSSLAAVNGGVVTVAGVETINIDSTDLNTTAHANSLTLTADAATKLVVTGNAGVTLTALTGSNVLATIDASASTGVLTATASGQVAMTITGGSKNDVLTASTGVTAKADVLVGGAGNDKLAVGSNGATLTGGAGSDTFIATASSAVTGSKEANTYSTITDFQAGDLLQLQYWDTVGAAKADVQSFAKLTASLNPETATFSNYVQAAMEQIDNSGLGNAVWFVLNGNSYVVIDSGSDSNDAFVNGEDIVVRLTGVDLSNASWNSTFATVSL
ncbi:DUF4214 domain-containing protein [Pseudoduganella sp. DS3]|uniref:DUF4214 domain-containing protein n=1 Tax=Pseudoduganella guangdongensis TaxID=2692179 RepID=A0A6N9HGZ3_9BURK|nr:DUF4214 domain-containing protein [Pseudoduganella guangdongensis]MYN02373.1 DUF4214 domain-containing protein [Pseudoduganella guangdongensis]